MNEENCPVAPDPVVDDFEVLVEPAIGEDGNVSAAIEYLLLRDVERPHEVVVALLTAEEYAQERWPKGTVDEDGEVRSSHAHLTHRSLTGDEPKASATLVARDALEPGESQTYYLVAGRLAPDIYRGGTPQLVFASHTTVLGPVELTRAEDPEPEPPIDPEPEPPVDPEPEPDPEVGPEIERVVGADRYGTAARLAVDNYAPGLPTVFLATGRDFPDALAGAALAGSYEAPVLLTRPDGLPAATRAALETLAPQQVVVLGGSGVVHGEVLDELTELGLAHVRLAGGDRYRTAAVVSAQLAPSDTVFIATGADYPDALAAAALAGGLDAPVLLTRPGSLPSASIMELARHNPDRVVVLGGAGAVQPQVPAQIERLGYPVERVSGGNRYSTAAALASWWKDGSDDAWLATGATYADALAGAPLAAREGGPVLLTRPGSLPAVTGRALLNLSPDTVHVLGGSGAINDAVLDDIAALGWE
ncbi:cell wall-binding repeat-containing protein [Ornithinimicrobium sp. Y1847]|uniref:cell wall-binding repeat-containing protein n=1 Tax=Ornithinimicrobium sp. Y1847 TaxID=3405419 RepID=UPI003B68220B